MEDKTYFFITTFTNLEKDNMGWLDTGASRCVGFYTDWETAYDVVTHNICDIWETIYKYAVIEELRNGLYPDCIRRQFFKYNKDNGMYEEIDEPECVKHFTNLSIG